MIKADEIIITRKTLLGQAMQALDRSGSGILLLTTDEGRFERTVTDGDLRRLVLAGISLNQSIAQISSINSHVASENVTRRGALAMMDEHEINHLPLVDSDGRVLKVLSRRDVDSQILLSTPHIGQREMEFVEEAFRTNWIAPLGPNVDAFERELSAYVGVGYAAALSSGTAALHLALILLDISSGDRVFCPSFTFAASANPIAYQNAEPVFIDSNDESWNMCPLALEQAFRTAKSENWLPKAVVVVNLYGQSADYDPIIALCDHYGVPIIEDAAESLGATYKGLPSGRFGKLAAYSFNGNKIITTSGGGMLVSDSEELIVRARFLSTQAREAFAHYEHREIGYNYRMSNILAGVGRGQLEVLPDRVSARRSIFKAYEDGLADLEGISWMPEPDWSNSTRWLSTCTIDKTQAGLNAAQLMSALAGEMIEARPLWKPMHRQPVFSGARYFTSGNDSVCDRLFETGICLPSGSNMTILEIERIISTIRNTLLNRKRGK